MDSADWGLLILLSIVWGGSFFFYKVLAPVLPPVTIVLGRMGVAAAALNVALRLRRERLDLSARLWLQFLLLALLNNVVPFTCFAFSEIRISSGLAAILVATTPVFSVLVGAGLGTGAPLTAMRGAAVAFGVLGVAVLIGPSALRGGGDLLSQLACLLGAVSYAFGGYYARRFSYLGALKVSTAQCTAAVVILLPLAAAMDRFWTLAPPGLTAWGALLGIGLVSTGLAYLFYFRLLGRVDPTDLLLVTFLVPISALGLGALFLGESVKPTAFLGMAMIGLSLIAIDGRIPARLRRGAGAAAA
jgi:drug/metabolite transporter (DMT)-like permease